MKRRIAVLSIAVLSIVALAIGLLACAPPAAPTIVNVNVTNITTVTIVLGQSIPSPVAGCPAISKVRVSYPDSLPRTQKAPISATPLDSDGKPREPKCDTDAEVSWSVSPSELLTVGDRHAFDTDVTAGNKAGSAALTVDIGAGGSGKGATNSFPITVT